MAWLTTSTQATMCRIPVHVQVRVDNAVVRLPSCSSPWPFLSPADVDADRALPCMDTCTAKGMSRSAHINASRCRKAYQSADCRHPPPQRQRIRTQTWHQLKTRLRCTQIIPAENSISQWQAGVRSIDVHFTVTHTNDEYGACVWRRYAVKGQISRREAPTLSGSGRHPKGGCQRYH